MSSSDDSNGRELRATWYAESFEVGNSALQFKVDCGQERSNAEGDSLQVYLRLITSPPNARQLFRMLGVALLRYADTFGPLDEPQTSASRRPS